MTDELENQAEEYYWQHTGLHEASKEQLWLKDVVKACFIDGYRRGNESGFRRGVEMAEAAVLGIHEKSPFGTDKTGRVMHREALSTIRALLDSSERKE